MKLGQALDIAADIAAAAAKRVDEGKAGTAMRIVAVVAKVAAKLARRGYGSDEIIEKITSVLGHDAEAVDAEIDEFIAQLPA